MELRARASTERTGLESARHLRARSSRGRFDVPLIAVAAAALLVAASGTAGTYALLTASATTSPTTTVITSGTADLRISTLPAMTTALYPGLTLFGAVTATNTGDVPLLIGVSGLTAPTGTGTTELSQSLIVGLGVAPSTTACNQGTVTPTWTGSFASAQASPIGATISVGAAQVLCVSVSLPLNASVASQGKTATNFALRISGTQV